MDEGARLAWGWVATQREACVSRRHYFALGGLARRKGQRHLDRDD
jgi:hypothetical protein